jgi:prephenate dehydrogenase
MPTPAGSSPFGRIAIVGLGLIGGSIAAAVRAAWPDVQISALDRPDVLADAEARGLISRRARTIEDIADIDLIVLAAPVPAILNLLPVIGRLGTRAVVTDVGSTKRHIMRAAADANLQRFIGGHPVAGAERPGLAQARPDLFERQPWLLVAGSPADAHSLTQLEAFVRGLGAEPHRLDADTHDRTMAYVSHLPQLLAVALINTAGAAVGESGLKLSGRAFGEMTRLASSPADLWQGILATNADYVAEASVAMANELPTRAARLDALRWIEHTFQHAGEWRRRLATVRPPEIR